MTRPAEDPLVHSARREAVVALVIFTAALVYTVTYCSLYGYLRPAADGESAVEELRFVLGFPEWVFWGVLVPWGVSTVAAWWMSFFFMRDEPLEEAVAPPDAPLAGEEDRRG